ncbi:NAD-dependent epimerase/dehydratase family protein [Shewanella litorisediminis]|uniref:NAD-dependent epimerase/dehydratase family protein n=1 Tax=Shewanella litorisediminis TaxID=1173586 RepID=A0ABX7FZQ9_9GAMM|nr:NAD-dependent epimerase/dehydratase family protein [Shewanella litorisediminis]MCL2919633.1 NAD-dependent epimerase/dehydratase family protein [Shewanella litorisediminis]QRH00524.1 NAD-dependent epimerase/dehydratase family protein [Shewanella litorisediminis]
MNLVTGANGFLGSRLLYHFNKKGIKYIAAVRNDNTHLKNCVSVGNIDGQTDWFHALDGVDCIIHCAARAHKVDNDSFEAKQDFLVTNFHGTKRLLEAAIQSKIQKFIYISSVKVMGNQSAVGDVFTEESNPNPQDYYGHSKLSAEKIVESMCVESGIKYFILRPCLIYGDGAKANIQSLTNAIEKLPIFPTFSSRNKRSLTNVNDLIEVITQLVDSKSHHTSGIYFIADSEPYSTKDLCHLIKSKVESNCCLIDVFNPLMNIVLLLPFFKSIREKLYGNLQVDGSKAIKHFGLHIRKNK